MRMSLGAHRSQRGQVLLGARDKAVVNCLMWYWELTLGPLQEQYLLSHLCISLISFSYYSLSFIIENNSNNMHRFVVNDKESTVQLTHLYTKYPYTLFMPILNSALRNPSMASDVQCPCKAVHVSLTSPLYMLVYSGDHSFSTCIKCNRYSLGISMTCWHMIHQHLLIFHWMGLTIKIRTLILGSHIKQNRDLQTARLLGLSNDIC